jgi:hypothetical protein
MVLLYSVWERAQRAFENFGGGSVAGWRRESVCLTTSDVFEKKDVTKNKSGDGLEKVLDIVWK